MELERSRLIIEMEKGGFVAFTFDNCCYVSHWVYPKLTLVCSPSSYFRSLV